MRYFKTIGGIGIRRYRHGNDRVGRSYNINNIRLRHTAWGIAEVVSCPHIEELI